MCFPSFSPGAPWLTQGIAFKVSGSNLPYYPLQCQRKIINFANNLHDSIYVAQPDIILCNQITHLFFFFFFCFCETNNTFIQLQDLEANYLLE